jgi:hypothetical protein
MRSAPPPAAASTLRPRTSSASDAPPRSPRPHRSGSPVSLLLPANYRIRSTGYALRSPGTNGLESLIAAAAASCPAGFRGRTGLAAGVRCGLPSTRTGLRGSSLARARPARCRSRCRTAPGRRQWQMPALSTPAPAQDPASTLRAACDAVSPIAVLPVASLHARDAPASARVLPESAGPIRTSATRGEVSAWNSAAAWSIRNPDPVISLRACDAVAASCPSKIVVSAPSSGLLAGQPCCRLGRGAAHPAARRRQALPGIAPARTLQREFGPLAHSPAEPAVWGSARVRRLTGRP